VIHTLDDLKVVFIDLFSCKRYEPHVVKVVIESHFEGRVRSLKTFAREY
jgi:hypothetical protein